MAASSLTWDIQLPDRARSAQLGARPRGKVVISAPETGEESFSVPVAVARSLSAAKDAGELHPSSRAEVLYLIRERSLSCARARVERLVDRRDYSARELSDKLAMDGYGASVREKVVERAVEVGIVNDARYADVFIRSRLASGWGVRRIEAELARRGIDTASVEGWPYDYLEGEGEEERAVALARTRRLAQKNGYEKLVRFLCGRGYSLGVACRAARQVVDERAEDSL